MTEKPLPQPPAINMSFGIMGYGITRAGTPAEQVAAQDRIWTILETVTHPGLPPWALLSQDWLGANRLRVQLFHHGDTRDNDTMKVGMKRLTETLRRHGLESLLGTYVSPDTPRPSAVWRVPAEADAIGLFMQELYFGFHILVPEDLRFALLANDGDYVAFAAPEDFLREALPPEAIGRKATAELIEELEQGYEPGSFDRVLAHYEPFMLTR